MTEQTSQKRFAITIGLDTLVESEEILAAADEVGVPGRYSHEPSPTNNDSLRESIAAMAGVSPSQGLGYFSLNQGQGAKEEATDFVRRLALKIEIKGAAIHGHAEDSWEKLII